MVCRFSWVTVSCALSWEVVQMAGLGIVDSIYRKAPQMAGMYLATDNRMQSDLCQGKEGTGDSSI